MESLINSECRYLVIDDNSRGDSWVDVYDTLDNANRASARTGSISPHPIAPLDASTSSRSSPTVLPTMCSAMRTAPLLTGRPGTAATPLTASSILQQLCAAADAMLWR